MVVRRLSLIKVSLSPRSEVQDSETIDVSGQLGSCWGAMINAWVREWHVDCFTSWMMVSSILRGVARAAARSSSNGVITA